MPKCRTHVIPVTIPVGSLLIGRIPVATDMLFINTRPILVWTSVGGSPVHHGYTRGCLPRVYQLPPRSATIFVTRGFHTRGSSTANIFESKIPVGANTVVDSIPEDINGMRSKRKYPWEYRGRSHVRPEMPLSVDTDTHAHGYHNAHWN